MLPNDRKQLLESVGATPSAEKNVPPFPTLVLPEGEYQQVDDLDQEIEERLERGDTVIVTVEEIDDEQLKRYLESQQEDSRDARVPEREAPRYKQQLQEEEQSRLEKIFEKRESKQLPYMGRNLYRVDDQGSIRMPIIGQVGMAGLNESQAAVRLGAEPLLKDYYIKVERLPVEKSGKEALKPYGYDLFEGVPTTFAPATDVPVPHDYVIGPGDVIQLQLFGKENEEYELAVKRNGTVAIPKIGPVSVAGLGFEQLEKKIHRMIKKQFIGVRANVTMGELRSIRIFVLGEVNKPGSYTVSALSTLTNALFFSGGVREIGSLRNIELKRGGKIVSKLDLYDFLMRGDTSGDIRLFQGDVIFVPTVVATASIDGEVRRPAVYELKGQQSLGELVAMAGGLKADADRSAIQLERVGGGGNKSLTDLDMMSEVTASYALQQGDRVTIFPVSKPMEQVVKLSGYAYRTGSYQWREGMRLVDLIPSTDLLRQQADLDYVLIGREEGIDRRLKIISTTLRDALNSPESDANVLLKPQDEIVILSLANDGSRQKMVLPYLERVEQRAWSDQSVSWVEINGAVRGAGRYPFEAGMRVNDAIRAAGKLNEKAYRLSAEITRVIRSDDGINRVVHLTVNLQEALSGVTAKNLELHPFDTIHFREIPEWSRTRMVNVQGEVRFPGEYKIIAGEKLSSLIKRIGGLTESAYPKAVVFLREELREREQQELNRLATQLESDIASSALSDNNARGGNDVEIAKQLAEQLRSTKAVGRLVINVPRLLIDMEEGRASEFDVVLKNGDRIFVPEQMQEVSIMGEVFHPSTLLFRNNKNRDDYIDASGGVTPKADDEHIYIVKADGSVSLGRNSWFEVTSEASIEPGDTIVVPLDVERIRTLTLWVEVSKILAQIGVAAASWHNIGIF
ncbi:SLBB domain-containing protein [Solemya pervernicosa gill symbiont]|nr:SLBB domain-containing protein [Solemya pervernicosa gill symbiont]